MKRAGGLFERVLAYENLRLAFWRASRGKRERDETRAYRQRLDAELVRLRDGLADGSYPVGNYRTFVVYEPKERLICAAPFCERVLHHALMNVCAPLFERWLVADTFACRPGLGQTAALVRGEMLVRRYDWYLKCDIRKYFYSISHDVVAAILRRKFKDRRIVFWFLKILSTYEASPGRGLPIGNLTSQYLANLYLDPLDRARAAWGMPCGYARYMDDFVFWSDSKETLRAIQSRPRSDGGLGAWRDAGAAVRLVSQVRHPQVFLQHFARRGGGDTEAEVQGQADRLLVSEDPVHL